MIYHVSLITMEFNKKKLISTVLHACIFIGDEENSCIGEWEFI